ncbi:MAG: hypothetical protein KAY37_08310 [Phycisphaerae bacterium]|nr:hypothetical protein [Phycisphaerae bacterium]
MRRELKRLVASRDEYVSRIDANIDAIQQLLSDDPELPFPPVQAAANNGTFAGQVRSALGEFKQPVRAAAVARLLEKRGMKRRGKYSLAQDISAELIRMSKRGTGGVEKVGRGLYRIQPES